MFNQFDAPELLVIFLRTHFLIPFAQVPSSYQSIGEGSCMQSPNHSLSLWVFLFGLDLVSVVDSVIGRTDYKRRVLEEEEEEEEDANSGQSKRKPQQASLRLSSGHSFLLISWVMSKSLDIAQSLEQTMSWKQFDDEKQFQPNHGLASCIDFLCFPYTGLD